MRADAFTTTTEAAAEHARLTTPAHDDRWDRYEPDHGPNRHGDDECEWDDLIHDAALQADRLLRGISWRRS